MQVFELWSLRSRFLVSPLEQSEVKQEDDNQDAEQYQSAAADEPSLPTHVDELASMVAVSGDHVEEIARARNVGEEALAWVQFLKETHKNYWHFSFHKQITSWIAFFVIAKFLNER